MKTDDLPISEPCCESWNEMTGDEIRRHCDLCDKDVVNLSEMTREEALEFLRTTPGPCVRYIYADSGHVIFLHPQIRRQRRGLRHLLGSAALVVPLLFATAACDATPDGGEELSAVAAEPQQDEIIVTAAPFEEANSIIIDAQGSARLAIADEELLSVLGDDESSDDRRDAEEDSNASDTREAWQPPPDRALMGRVMPAKLEDHPPPSIIAP